MSMRCVWVVAGLGLLTSACDNGPATAGPAGGGSGGNGAGGGAAGTAGQGGPGGPGGQGGTAEPIVRKGSVSGSALGASLTLPAPPDGTAAGDTLIAQVVLRDAASPASPPDDGWTRLFEQGDGAASIYQAVYGRRAAGAGDGAGTWTAPAGASSLTVTLTAFAHVDPSQPARAVAAAAGGPDIDFPAPDLAGAAAGDQALVFLASDGGPRPYADQGTVLGVISSGGVPGGWVDRATLHAFQNAIGRPVVFGHSWMPWNGAGGLPAAATGRGPLSDFEEGRLSVVSWPAEQSWPDGMAAGNGDPAGTLRAIADGAYDALIAGNARVLRDFGQPVIFRLFCEMNGGDHPWEVGHQTRPPLTAQNYASAFVAAWRRIWLIMRGTPADAAAAGVPDLTTFVQAKNVLFHWNPQTFQTTALVSWDDLWPGDDTVDFAGTELYIRSSATTTFESLITDTSDGRGTHSPLYATYGPGGSRNQRRGGLLGNGEGGNNDSLAGTRSFIDAASGLPAHPAWKFFSWWDYGPNLVERQTGSVLAAVQSFFADPTMNPTLDQSFDVPAGWSQAYQYRFQTGRAAGANAGANQSGSLLLVRTAGAASVPGPTIAGYGFGRWSAITMALAPAAR